MSRSQQRFELVQLALAAHGRELGPSLVVHRVEGQYDTHAVFLAYGPGISGGQRAEKITPLHAAAVLADQLGVKPPKHARYGLPETLKQP